VSQCQSTLFACEFCGWGLGLHRAGRDIVVRWLRVAFVNKRRV